MKKSLSPVLILLVFQLTAIFAFNTVSVTAQTVKQTVLTNTDVTEMVKSGFSESIIVAKIRSSPGKYDTSTAVLQQLKKSGASDAVILAMVQKSDVSSPAVAASNGVAGNVTVPDGTEIKILVAEEISGKKAVEGDPLNFKVAEDVIVNGKVVISKDTIAKGVVASAKKSGMMGRGGNLSIRVESAQSVDGQKIRLRAAKSGEGGDKMGSTVALTVLFGPLGLLKKGKNAVIKAGTILSAYTDESKIVMAN